MALLSLAAAAGATLWILQRSGADPAEALRYLPARAHLLAAGAFAVDLLARGTRVLLVARGLGLPLTLGTSVKAQLAGEGLGAVTPSRVGADPAKIWVLRRDGMGVGSCGALLVAEMGAESLVLLLSAAVILLGPWSPWLGAGLAAYALVVSSVGIAAFLVSRASDTDPPSLWLRLGLGAGRWAALRRATREFRADTTRLRNLRAPWVAGVLGATVVHMVARVSVLSLLVLPMLAAGAASLPPGGATELVLRPFFVLYTTALLPPPGGGGGVEVVFATLLGGVLPDAVLASALVWWRVYTFYLGAALGALVLLGPGVAAPWRSAGSEDRERGGGVATERPGGGEDEPGARAAPDRTPTAPDTAPSPEMTRSFSERAGAS